MCMWVCIYGPGVRRAASDVSILHVQKLDSKLYTDPPCNRNQHISLQKNCVKNTLSERTHIPPQKNRADSTVESCKGEFSTNTLGSHRTTAESVRSKTRHHSTDLVQLIKTGSHSWHIIYIKQISCFRKTWNEIESKKPLVSLVVICGIATQK